MKHARHVCLTSLVLVVLLALSMVAGSGAQGTAGDQVVIGADQIINDDLYITASELIIDGTVNGDVLALARSIIINGTVQGDLIAAAQVIVLNGVVQDDARLAAQAVVLGKGSKISDDVMAAGFSFEAAPGSSVGGDLWLGAYQAALAGEVGGNVTAGANGLRIGGRVNGNVKLAVGEAEPTPSVSFTQFMPALPAGVTYPAVPAGLTIPTGAQVGGNVEYTSRAEASIADGAVAGHISHQQPSPPQETGARPAPAAVFLSWLLDQARRLLRLLTVGLLLVWLAHGWLRRAAGALRSGPWRSLGWGVLSPFAVLAGLAGLFIVVLLIALLLSTVIGSATLVTVLLASLSGTLLLGYGLLMFYVAALVGGFTIGELVLRRLDTDHPPNRWLCMILGVVVVWVVTLVPVLGSIIGGVLALFGMGASWLAIRSRPLPSVPAITAAPAA